MFKLKPGPTLISNGGNGNGGTTEKGPGAQVQLFPAQQKHGGNDGVFLRPQPPTTPKTTATPARTEPPRTPPPAPQKKKRQTEEATEKATTERPKFKLTRPKFTLRSPERPQQQAADAATVATAVAVQETPKTAAKEESGDEEPKPKRQKNEEEQKPKETVGAVDWHSADNAMRARITGVEERLGKVRGELVASAEAVQDLALRVALFRGNVFMMDSPAFALRVEKALEM